MHVVGQGRGRGQALVLSATDLANFLGCRHRTALDMSVAFGARDRRPPRRPVARGALEARPRARAKVCRVPSRQRRFDRRVERDRRPGRAGHSKRARRWRKATTSSSRVDWPTATGSDVLTSCAAWRAPSALGEWSYEISDTKLARETKAGTILQLGLYSEMLAALQEVRARDPSTS